MKILPRIIVILLLHASTFFCLSNDSDYPTGSTSDITDNSDSLRVNIYGNAVVQPGEYWSHQITIKSSSKNNVTAAMTFTSDDFSHYGDSMEFYITDQEGFNDFVGEQNRKVGHLKIVRSLWCYKYGQGGSSTGVLPVGNLYIIADNVKWGAPSNWVEHKFSFVILSDGKQDHSPANEISMLDFQSSFPIHASAASVSKLLPVTNNVLPPHSSSTVESVTQPTSVAMPGYGINSTTEKGSSSSAYVPGQGVDGGYFPNVKPPK